MNSLEKEKLYKWYNIFCSLAMVLSILGLFGVYCYYVCEPYDPIIVFGEFILAGIFYTLSLAFMKAIIIKRRNENADR